MSRYWVFHDRRLKGPLNAEELAALDGFTGDTRVCPEGGPETDWRPAREHAELAGRVPANAATATAGLPSIPRLSPVAADAAPAADDDGRLEALERALEEQRATIERLSKQVEDLRRDKSASDRRLEELAGAVASATEQLSSLKSATAPANEAPMLEPQPKLEPEPFFKRESAPLFESKPEPEPLFKPEPEPSLPPPPPAPPPAPLFAEPAPLKEPEPTDGSTLPVPPPFSALGDAPAERPFALPAAPPPPPKTEETTRTFDAPPPFAAPRATPPEDRTMILDARAFDLTPPAGETRKLRVLCADDDELMRQTIAATFRKAGHDCEAVEDGTKALERIATNPYDLVVLDEGMPSGSGFQVARAVAQVDKDARPKVLIFTAQYVGNRLAKETFLMSGADDVLSKDSGMTGLLKKAHELFGLPAPKD